MEFYFGGQLDLRQRRVFIVGFKMQFMLGIRQEYMSITFPTQRELSAKVFSLREAITATTNARPSPGGHSRTLHQADRRKSIGKVFNCGCPCKILRQNKPCTG
ncbi:hypothetical protein TNIN_163041 [Trichonephila inaurata madagascariensis]|uniref:Uncharacterized protein n=1 Tax=Trichonephila inaurata madagascariensis TaxID=2747483 RepID=A0A8X6YMQ6_9ARAC|nr:hypothetical protein TNIN_163041 [Trichonephila inaurata madagascariensis]